MVLKSLIFAVCAVASLAFWLIVSHILMCGLMAYVRRRNFFVMIVEYWPALWSYTILYPFYILHLELPVRLSQRCKVPADKDSLDSYNNLADQLGIERIGRDEQTF